MTMAMSAARAVRAAARGFTILELVLVLIVVGVAGVVAVDRFLYYQELAEKAAMDATLASFKMGLQIRSAELAISNGQSAAGGLENENPVRWLAEAPANFAGEYPARPQPGQWYFVARDATLVYVPSSSRYLTLPKGTNGELRFKIKLNRDVAPASAGGSRMPEGVSIVATSEYQWF